jgi:hypothetical protein
MALALVIVNETMRASARDLVNLSLALEQNAQHIAKGWGIVAPTIDVVDKMDRVPGHYHPMRIVEGSDDDPGAGAVHYFDVLRGGPAAVIYADRASGFNVGSFSVAEALSHELELLCNPQVNLWLPHPDPSRVGVQCAREICDPLQSTYDITIRGVPWKMCNFVLPSWFDQSAHDPEIKRRIMAGAGFDHAKKLDHPGHIGGEGYVVLRKRNEHGAWEMWFEAANGQRFGSAPVKNPLELAHKALASSRSKALLKSCEAQAA